MYETYTTVVGTIVTSPVVRSIGDSGEPVLNFRLAGNVRRTDSSGEWVDGDTLYLTVGCRRRLVNGVSGVLDKGDPVIVYGRIHTDEYLTKDGMRRSDLVMRASAVGPDVARVRVHLERSAAGHVEPGPVADAERRPVTDVQRGPVGDAVGAVVGAAVAGGYDPAG